MRILLCNDDGVHAHGIEILYKHLKKLGEVTVVAPLEERSTAGHSLTLHKPLRLVPIKKDFYGINGSPADCVHVGISQVMKKRPDIVVSGINRGANLGQDVFYSGTVSAAREACMMGLPAMAVSLAIDFYKRRPETEHHYDTAGVMALKVIRHFVAQKRDKKSKSLIDLPEHTLLNLNVPDITLKKIKGVSLARQGFRYYGSDIIKRRDHRGKDYFWVGGGYKGYLEEAGTDCDVVETNYASLTPLRLDCTYHEYMVELMEDWGNRVVMK